MHPRIMISGADTINIPDLLVRDKTGYLSLDGQGSNLSFHIISARHEQKSTIVSIIALCTMENIFDTISAATAIADHLVYNLEILIMGRRVIGRRSVR